MLAQVHPPAGSRCRRSVASFSAAVSTVLVFKRRTVSQARDHHEVDISPPSVRFHSTDRQALARPAGSGGLLRLAASLVSIRSHLILLAVGLVHHVERSPRPRPGKAQAASCCSVRSRSDGGRAWVQPGFMMRTRERQTLKLSETLDTGDASGRDTEAGTTFKCTSSGVGDQFTVLHRLDPPCNAAS